LVELIPKISQKEEASMKVRMGCLLVAAVALAATAGRADEVKTSAKFGGAFDITALTGDNKGKSFCYV
jgi:hypothetical protein